MGTDGSGKAQAGLSEQGQQFEPSHQLQPPAQSPDHKKTKHFAIPILAALAAVTGPAGGALRVRFQL